MRKLSRLHVRVALAVAACCSASDAAGMRPRFQPSAPWPSQTVSTDGVNPVRRHAGGRNSDDAKAMGAFLKAEFAMNEGDRAEALSSTKRPSSTTPTAPSFASSSPRCMSARAPEGGAGAGQSRRSRKSPRPRRAPARRRNQFRARQRCDAEQDYKAVLRADPKNQEAYLLPRHALRQARGLHQHAGDLQKAHRRSIRIPSSATTTPAASWWRRRIIRPPRTTTPRRST